MVSTLAGGAEDKLSSEVQIVIGITTLVIDDRLILGASQAVGEGDRVTNL
ncbi:MAG: hypothetical protein WBC73_04570 [Phormidesmis sp.]